MSDGRLRADASRLEQAINDLHEQDSLDADTRGNQLAQLEKQAEKLQKALEDREADHEKELVDSREAGEPKKLSIDDAESSAVNASTKLDEARAEVQEVRDELQYRLGALARCRCDRKKGGGGSGARVCCKAMTASCLSCAKGQSEKEFCTSSGKGESVPGCEKYKARAASALALRASAGRALRGPTGDDEVDHVLLTRKVQDLERQRVELEERQVDHAMDFSNKQRGLVERIDALKLKLRQQASASAKERAVGERLHQGLRRQVRAAAHWAESLEVKRRRAEEDVTTLRKRLDDADATLKSCGCPRY